MKNLLISEKYVLTSAKHCLWKILALTGYNTTSYRGVVTSGPGGPCPPLPPLPPSTSIFEPNKVQQFQFQTSGIMLLMGVQKLYRPKILQFLPSMLQYLNNLRHLFIFSNCIGEIDHFTFDILKRSDS